MYLLDTDVVSESRKGRRANAGVRRFLSEAAACDAPMFLSVVTVGELRRGIELLRHRNDDRQVQLLDGWLTKLLSDHEDHILEFGQEEAQVWGHLRAPQAENALDKQIAATAITHGLTVVTRNARHFERLGVEVVDPFE